MTVRLAFDSVGEGPPVVVLHGLFGSSTNWRGVARALAGRHRVLSVDLRNHGASPWTDVMTYPDMAADVLALIEQEKLDRPIVVGHSMGGKTAMALALLHPAAVGRLVVVDIAPVTYHDRFSPYVHAMAGIDTLAAGSRAEVQRRLAERIPEQGIVGFLMQNLVSRNDHFDWRLNLAALGASLPALGDFPPSLLALRYDGPVRVITGALSDYVKPDDAARFAALFPHARIEAIEGAGHWVHAEKPDAFIAALRRALDDAP